MEKSTSLENKQALAGFSEAASAFIVSKMKEKGLTYDDLVNRLEQRGIVFSSSNMRNKISRHSLSAGLFFAILTELESPSDEDFKQAASATYLKGIIR